MADAPPPPKVYQDGWNALPAGMDAGRDASLIGKDQVSLAVNTTFRGGFPRTRPYMVYRPLKFTSDEEKDWFENELYQGCYFYSLVAAPNTAVVTSNAGILCYMVGGRLWTIDPVTYRVVEITPNPDRNSRKRNLAFFVQAEQWLIVQDGQSAAILWDGSNARRAGLNEVPVGTNMAYGQGRTFVKVGDEILAGDIVGGPGGPNAVINFTERLELALNSDINPSFVIGTPTFMEFIPQQDTATGVGTLLIGGTHGVTSLFAEKPRDQWKDGIARVVLFNIGGTGHRSPAQINGDIWWRSAEGIRAYRQARAQVGLLAQLPLSTELDPFFAADSPELLPWVSSAYFDNRFLCTIGPRVMNSRVYFQGLAVADFNVLSSFGQTITKPAWDGVWTGVNILELKQGGGRLFAPSVDELGRNCLYEILADRQVQVADKGINGALRPVEGQLVSGAYVGQGSTGDAVKILIGGKFSLRQIKEEVSLSIDYRKDGEQCFQTWDNFNLCAPYTLCTLAPDLSKSPCPPLVANPQYRDPIKLRQPNAEENIDSAPPTGAGIGGDNSTPMVNGYEFQARFKFTGNMQLRNFEMKFQDGFERVTSGCYPPETCVASNVCCEDLFEFTPKLPVYTIPTNPVDPRAGILAAQQAIINFLGNGLLTPIQVVLAGIPLPPADVNNALIDLINTGVILHPSSPVTPQAPQGHVGYVRLN